MAKHDDDTDRVLVFTFIFFMSLLFAFFICFLNTSKVEDSPVITGYMAYYYYGYKDDKFVFEVCTTTEENGVGEKTIYVVNPSQRDNILRYNDVNSYMTYYLSKKSLYEIRRE